MWVEKWNTIHKQLKGQNSTITAKEWNFIINVLKDQTNNNTKGILDLKKASDNIIKFYTPVLSSEQEEAIRIQMQDFIESLIQEIDDNILNLDTYLTNIFSEFSDIKRTHIKISYNEPTDDEIVFWGKLTDR